MASPTITSMTEYLDLDQAAERLNLEPSDLYVIIRQGEIRAAWVPSRKTWYLNVGEVEAYRNAH